MYAKTIAIVAVLGAASLAVGLHGSPEAEAAATAAPKASMSRPSASAGTSPQIQPVPQCVQVNSTTWSSCKDAGNYDSTCATAKCGAGYTLTGGGGACAAGDRKIKSLSPNLSTGEFSIMCEKQGVKPQAKAICCKL